MMTWIITSEGKPWDIFDPKAEVVTPEVLARSLSRIPRFLGHLRDFYSVAQHSCLVASLLPRPVAIHGLLHDAHEAFTGDIPTPLKAQMPWMDGLQERYDAVIYEALGVEPPDADTLVLVKCADRAAFNAEITQLGPPNRERHVPLYTTPYEVTWTIDTQTPWQAEEEWLKRLQGLIQRH